MEAADQAILLAFQQLGELETIHVYEGKTRASMLAYGWWARIVRTGEAIRQLHSAGFDHEAAPLVRTVLDHATSLTWLAQEPDEAVEAYEWHRQWKQSALATSAEKLEWELEVDYVPGAPPKKLRPAPVFDPAPLAEQHRDG